MVDLGRWMGEEYRVPGPPFELPIPGEDEVAGEFHRRYMETEPANDSSGRDDE